MFDDLGASLTSLHGVVPDHHVSIGDGLDQIEVIHQGGGANGVEPHAGCGHQHTGDQQTPEGSEMEARQLGAGNDHEQEPAQQHISTAPLRHSSGRELGQVDERKSSEGDAGDDAVLPTAHAQRCPGDHERGGRHHAGHECRPEPDDPQRKNRRESR